MPRYQLTITSIFCSLLSACGGGGGNTNSESAGSTQGSLPPASSPVPISITTPAPVSITTPAPVSITTPAPNSSSPPLTDLIMPTAAPTTAPLPTTNPALWPITAYKTIKINDANSFTQSANVTSSAPDKGAITVDGISLQLTGTPAADNLLVNGWAGNWAHKVDFRAIMLCDATPAHKSQYVLIEDRSTIIQRSEIVEVINGQEFMRDSSEIMGKRFEYVENCTRDSREIITGIGTASRTNPADASATKSVWTNFWRPDLASAFSNQGFNNGTQTTYLKAYKVFYPTGQYWYFIVEIGKHNTDPTKSYIGWWKEIPLFLN